MSRYEPPKINYTHTINTLLGDQHICLRACVSEGHLKDTQDIYIVVNYFVCSQQNQYRLVAIVLLANVNLLRLPS